MGIQGCGKGTQASMLSKRFSWRHINMGEEFRQHIADKTDLGNIAVKYIEKGDLVPDEFVFQLLGEAVKKNETGFVLDGFPRNLQQEIYLDAHYDIDRVLFLRLDEKIAIERISARRECENCKTNYNLLWKRPAKEGICDICGGKLLQRDDDREEVIERRLEKYFARTRPIVENYRKKGILIEVDANQSIKDVHEEIVTRLTQ